jgi:hypothetical protein
VKVKVGDYVEHIHGARGRVMERFVSGGNVWLRVRWAGKKCVVGECMERCVCPLPEVTKVVKERARCYERCRTTWRI